VTGGGKALFDLNLPLVIGHRGAAAHAPENTLAGFRKARELGCAWVEFDVRSAAGDALIVCHDAKLDRTTNGPGRAATMPLAAIRRLDAGSWFSVDFAGERVPTVEDSLALCRELGLGANVEIKAERGRGAATAAAVSACLDRFAERLPPILISSFLTEAVAEASAHSPTIPRGMLWRKIPRDWQRRAAELGCATIHADHNSLSESLVAAICGAGYPLLAYTVNDAARARQLFGWGVTSVFSDAPDIILAAAGTFAGARRGARL
jgi:glycerophosphoryl diester phosphodiesterase